MSGAMLPERLPPCLPPARFLHRRFRSGPAVPAVQRRGERAGLGGPGEIRVLRRFEGGGQFAELVLVRQGPQVGPAMPAAPGQAGEIGLQPDHLEHHEGRAFRHRNRPGPFQPVEQDPGLPPRRLAPQQPDLAHPLDDMGPLHQGMAGLARRAFRIAGPPRRLGHPV